MCLCVFDDAMMPCVSELDCDFLDFEFKNVSSLNMAACYMLLVLPLHSVDC